MYVHVFYDLIVIHYVVGPLSLSKHVRLSCVFYSKLTYILTKQASYGASCENMTSSTRPKVNNVSQRRQRKNEPRPQSLCTQIWWSSAVWFLIYASRDADRQTDRQTLSSQYFALLSAEKSVKQESCAIAKMTAWCALFMSALKVFETPYRPSIVTFPLS